MTIFLAVLVWKKAPAALGAMLDKRIAEIKQQLSEAEQLRLDAESLKAEYEAKLADAAKEAGELRARAEAEAEALGAKAKDEDRKSVVEGKSVSVRVDLGGRSIMKKKKHQNTTINNTET